MEKETKHYVEYLNHNPKWLKMITIEIDKFLINSEYINFFIIMYMRCSKDDGSFSSSQTLIIKRLPHFEKLGLSQFKVYIETETMSYYFVWCNCQKNILIKSAEGKESFFCILHMLRIHTGLRKLSKKNVYDFYLKNMNLFEIVKPCIIIARRE